MGRRPALRVLGAALAAALAGPLAGLAGPRGAWAQDIPTEEAAARKARSLAQLRREGVPVLPSLPVIATEAQSLRRDPEAVVQRSIGLAITAVTGELGDPDLAHGLIRQFGADGFLTPEESAFVLEPHLFDRAKFGWRYEGVRVLLWALGLADLPYPEAIVDVGPMTAELRDLGTEGLRRAARLRPQAEILDATDLHYRYHWAVVQARLDGTPPPARLYPGVVYERHYALNWLIGSGGQDWDAIRTDT